MNVIVVLPLEGTTKPVTGAGIETTVVPTPSGSKKVCFETPVPPFHTIGLAVIAPTAVFELVTGTLMFKPPRTSWSLATFNVTGSRRLDVTLTVMFGAPLVVVIAVAKLGP